MELFNIHTHTLNSHDGKATVEELCENALTNGLSGFAVTDHCDCEYASEPSVFAGVMNSFSDSERAKEACNGKLIVASGVEIGEALYDPVFAEKVIRAKPWDVVLGSVHAVRFGEYSMPFSMIDFSDWDDERIDRYITAYFSDMTEMAGSADFDVLCHLTVPLRYICGRFGKKVQLEKYYPAIRQILSVIIHDGKTLEVNTSGWSEERAFFMPDENIISMYLSLGGTRFTLGSDAHTADRLCTGLREGAETLRNMGIKKLTYYIGRKPVDYSI